MRLGSWMCPADSASLYLSSPQSNSLHLLSGPRGERPDALINLNLNVNSFLLKISSVVLLKK